MFDRASTEALDLKDVGVGKLFEAVRCVAELDRIVGFAVEVEGSSRTELNLFTSACMSPLARGMALCCLDEVFSLIGEGVFRFSRDLFHRAETGEGL